MSSFGSQINGTLIYKEHDVCDNLTALVEIVQNLNLDEHFQIQEKEKNHSKSSIIAVFMYTPLQMATFVKNAFPQIPVYDVDHRIQKDGSI